MRKYPPFMLKLAYFRRVVFVAIFAFYYTMSITGVTVADLDPLDRSTNQVHFLGHDFTTGEWTHIKKIVQCWGRKGTWKLNKSIALQDPIYSYEENIQRQSPCFHPQNPGQFYGQASGCYWTLDFDSLKYEWQLKPPVQTESSSDPPMGVCHGTVLEPFLTDSFCDMMQSAGVTDIMIVGDSMSFLFGMSLRSLSYLSGPSGLIEPLPSYTECAVSNELPFTFPCYCGDGKKSGIDASAEDGKEKGLSSARGRTCSRSFFTDNDNQNQTLKGMADLHPNSGLRLHTIRNDRLSLTDHLIKNTGENFIEDDFAHIYKRLGVKLMVLNRGAHYEEDEVLLASLNTTLHYLLRSPRTEGSSGPDGGVSEQPISIIWRTTPYGHTQYKSYQYSPPLDYPPLPQHLNSFNYLHFERQNRLVLRLLEEHYPEVLVLDVFPSTVLRADAHADPLHYCHPSGTLFNWVRLFYNAIRLVQQYKDIIAGQ